MSTTIYDANSPVPPQEWLGLSARERLRLVSNYHQQPSVHRGNKQHALMHVLVEDYLARGFGPAKRALEYLVAAGNSRHSAIHSLAAPAGEVLLSSTTATESPEPALAAAFAAVVAAKPSNP